MNRTLTTLAACLLLSVIQSVAQTISTGAAHTFVVCADGHVQAMGSNSYGQLGLGEAVDDAFTPILIPNLENVSAAIAGSDHSIFIKSDGTVWCTGDNSYGELGDGTFNDSFLPVQALGINNAVSGSAMYHSLVLLSDSTVMAWGENGVGHCGIGTTEDTPTPTLIQGLDDVVAISAGYYYSLALKADGTVWAWGSNSNGQLGNNDLSIAFSSVPEQVDTLHDIIAIDAGGSLSLALQSNGHVWVWGSNTQGELGTGDGLDHPAPILLDSLGNIVSIAAGGMYGLLVNDAGQVKSWGRNWSGQLGNGTNVDSSSPVDVLISDVVQVWTGNDSHTLFLKSDGSMWGCGSNGGGEMGALEPGFYLTPVEFGSELCIMNSVSPSSSNTRIALFPNPCSDKLQIRSDDVITGLRIWNLAGELVYSSRENAQQVELQTDAWPAGFYMMQLEGIQGTHEIKFTKH